MYVVWQPVRVSYGKTRYPWNSGKKYHQVDATLPRLRRDIGLNEGQDRARHKWDTIKLSQRMKAMSFRTFHGIGMSRDMRRDGTGHGPSRPLTSRPHEFPGPRFLSRQFCRPRGEYRSRAVLLQGNTRRVAHELPRITNPIGLSNSLSKNTEQT